MSTYNEEAFAALVKSASRKSAEAAVYLVRILAECNGPAETTMAHVDAVANLAAALSALESTARDLARDAFPDTRRTAADLQSVREILAAEGACERAECLVDGDYLGAMDC